MGKIYTCFKFVSNRRRDVLEKGMIKFSPIGDFNDPFELQPIISPVSRKYIDHFNSLTEVERGKQKMTQEDYQYSCERYDMLPLYRNKYREEIGQYGVLSLSSNQDVNEFISVSVPENKDPRRNILMWSHYANSHNGFIIEFYKDFIPESELVQVEYSEVRDFLTFEDVDEEKFDHVFYRKSIEWSYEQEYRCVLPLSKASEIDGGKHHLFKFDKSKVRSITFGCKMSEEEKLEIIDYVKSNKEFGSVVFNHARLDDLHYILDIYHDDGQWSNNPDSPFATQTIPEQIKF